MKNSDKNVLLAVLKSNVNSVNEIVLKNSSGTDVANNNTFSWSTPSGGVMTTSDLSFEMTAGGVLASVNLLSNDLVFSEISFSQGYSDGDVVKLTGISLTIN